MEECKHRKRIKIDGSDVCADCGMIMEEDSLVSTQIDDYSDRHAILPELIPLQRLAKYPRNRADRLLSEFIDNLGHSFNLPLHIRERAIKVVDEAVAQGLINRGQAGRRAGTAALFLISRSESLPITISELAAAIHDSPQQLLSQLQLIRPLIPAASLSSLDVNNPIIFLERYLSYLEASQTSRLLKVAINLVEFCEQKSLIEGRMPAAVALACLLVAAEAQGYHPIEANVCDRAGLRWDTVRKRIRELKNTLVQSAREDSLLKDRHLTYNQIAIFAEELVQRQKKNHHSTESSPPSFVASVQTMHRRKEQIEAALLRIANSEEKNSSNNEGEDNVNNNSENLTLEDIVIERLLLHGISPLQIESLSSLSQLLSLEETLI